jgi:hypothetical protein
MLLAWAVAVGLLFWNSSFLYGVVCRMPGIAGYESQYHAAQKVLPSTTTTDLSECEIYVTRRGAEIYAHSNYRSFESSDKARVDFNYHKYPTKLAAPNDKLRRFIDVATNNTSDEGRFSFNRKVSYHEYPTKIAEPDGKSKSLIDLANNIAVDSEQALRTFADEIEHVSDEHIKYYLDPSMFREDGSLGIEVGKTKNLFVADPNAPPPKRLFRTGSARGPPWMAKISPSLTMKVGPRFNPARVLERLSQTPLQKRTFKLISLINDLATETELQRLPLAGNLARLPALTGNAVRDVFRKNARGTVAILGHVENARFVVKDIAGVNVLFDFPIERLNALAKEFRCNVIYLGCFAGREGVGAGAIDSFNPIYALRRLAEALSEPNYEAFLNKLAGEELGLVLDDSAFMQAEKDVSASSTAPEMKIGIFDVKNDWPRSVNEGDVVMRGGVILARPSGMPGWIIGLGLFSVILLVVAVILLFRRHKHGNA